MAGEHGYLPGIHEDSGSNSENEFLNDDGGPDRVQFDVAFDNEEDGPFPKD